MTPFKTIKPSTLDRDAFVAAFADVYEHSPRVAETVYGAGVDETLDYVEVMHTRLSGRCSPPTTTPSSRWSMRTGSGRQGGRARRADCRQHLRTGGRRHP